MVIDPQTEEVLGVFNAAFHLRPTDEGELSVNHLEHYGGETAEQIKAVVQAKRNDGFGVSNNSAFAVLQAGDVTGAGQKVGLSLASYKDPMLPHDPSHAIVRGLPDDSSSEIFEDLARIASRQFFVVKDLK